MALIDSAKDVMLNALGTDAVYVSLHSAYPGDNGANELSGGSPAYARSAVTWAAAANSSTSASNQPHFDVPPGSTVLFGGLWSAATAGTFYGSFPLASGANALIGAVDTSGTTILAPGQSFAVGSTVVVGPVDGTQSIPNGYTAGNIYYVASSSGNAVGLSATSGGAVITATSGGLLTIQTITGESFNGQGVYTLATVDISLS